MTDVQMYFDGSGGVSIVDPSIAVLTVDAAKVPALCQVENNENAVRKFSDAVLEALPKTLMFAEFYENGTLFALKFLYSVSDNMKDCFSDSPLYRLENTSNVPFVFDGSLMGFYPKGNKKFEPCVLDRPLWDSICDTLNSDSFKKKAFPTIQGNA